jgi:hypothetical protein
MIKKIFHKLSTREKALLAAILWTLIVFWSSSNIGDFSKIIKDWKRTNSQLKDNAAWLNKKESIELELKEAYTKLDPSKTFNQSKLTESIDTLARDNNLAGSGFGGVKAKKSQPYDIVQVHYAEIDVTTTIDKLIEFDQKLKEKSPYMALEDIKIKPKTSEPQMLSAKLTIKALELKPGTDI